jgi:ribosomal protein S18 acetylase RimI-like enzyme
MPPIVGCNRWTRSRRQRKGTLVNELELVFRDAALDDVGRIVDLVESAYRGDRSRLGWTTEADLLDGQRTDRLEIEQVMADPRARLIVATRGADLLGCVLVRDERTSAYIGMLAVDPRQQQLGLGRRLLAHAERIALVEFGAPSVRMTVIVQRQDLIQWYVRRGYSVTQEREPFPYGDPRFGLPRRPDLEFAVLRRRLTAV